MPNFGATFPSDYFYLEVPWETVVQQTPTFAPFASIQPYDAIEDFIRVHMMNVERKDLHDLSRVYRFPNTMWKYFERCGDHYLEILNCLRFDLLWFDPSVGKLVLRDWAPV